MVNLIRVKEIWNEGISSETIISINYLGLCNNGIDILYKTNCG